MYSFLVASRQLYCDFLVDVFAQLLWPAESSASAPLDGDKQPMKSSFHTTAETLGLVATLTSMLGMALSWLLLGTLLFVLLLASLHRPLPAFIADRKKIALFEFLMRISNEYIGALVGFCAGPEMRNKFTRFIASLTFPVLPESLCQWLYNARWCGIRNERIAGVKCRVYLPRGQMRRSDACLVYIHGGGWCIGRPRFYDGALLYLVKKLGIPIISIDYTLSPEVRFPTALHECERVIDALHNEKFAEYGIDRTRIALMGDSAGGNLCAVLCQKVLRKGEPSKIRCHLLVYPVIHMLNFRSPAYRFYYRKYPGTGLLNPELLIRWYLMYLGIEPSAHNVRAVADNRHLAKEIVQKKELMALADDAKLPKGLPGEEESQRKEGKKTTTHSAWGRFWKPTNNKVEPNNDLLDRELSEKMAPFLVNPELCPLVESDLRGLCPALVCTAGIDILRDEGILYAQKLRSAGCEVEWKHYEAAYHGILNMCHSAQKRQILSDISGYLHKYLLS